MRQLCPKETDLGEYRSSSVHVSLSAKFAEHCRLPQDFVRFSGSSLLVMYLLRVRVFPENTTQTLISYLIDCKEDKERGSDSN